MDEKIRDSLNVLYKTMAKKFQDDSVFFIGQEKHKSWGDNIIPTGSLKLDIALGIGGYPRGRIMEIYGHESTGKTSLALHAIAEAQKQGQRAAGFVDVEQALDINYADSLGVNIEDLILSQPNSAEEALDITEAWVKSNLFDIIVIDSVSALTPMRELDGDMGDAHVGLQARLMSQAMRKLAAAVRQTNTLVIFINQIRMKIGVMFGNPETTSGGKALKFYASVRLEVRRKNIDKEGGRNDMKVTVVKNKMAPPYKVAEVGFIWGEGIDHLGEIITLAETADIIKRGGAWYTLPSGQKVQGLDNMKETLLANSELKKEIETQVMKTLEQQIRD